MTSIADILKECGSIDPETQGRVATLVEAYASERADALDLDHEGRIARLRADVDALAKVYVPIDSDTQYRVGQIEDRLSALERASAAPQANCPDCPHSYGAHGEEGCMATPLGEPCDCGMTSRELAMRGSVAPQPWSSSINAARAEGFRSAIEAAAKLCDEQSRHDSQMAETLQDWRASGWEARAAGAAEMSMKIRSLKVGAPVTNDCPGHAKAPDETKPCVYCRNENVGVEVTPRGFAVYCGFDLCRARGPVRRAQMDAVAEWNRAYEWVHPPGEAPTPASPPPPPRAEEVCPECGHASDRHLILHPGICLETGCLCQLTRSKITRRLAAARDEGTQPVELDTFDDAPLDIRHEYDADRICLEIGRAVDGLMGPSNFQTRVKYAAEAAVRDAFARPPHEQPTPPAAQDAAPRVGDVPAWVPSVDELWSAYNAGWKKRHEENRRAGTYECERAGMFELRRLIATRTPRGASVDVAVLRDAIVASMRARGGTAITTDDVQLALGEQGVEVRS